MEKICGLINLHNAPALGALTANRTPASVSFLSRYAVIDFALSNMVNSDIDYIGVLAPDSIRSLTQHIGSGAPWMTNTKNSKVQVLYDEPHSKMVGYSNDVNNILENWWFIQESRADYILITPAQLIGTFDYRDIFNYAKTMGAHCVMGYVSVNDADDGPRGGEIVEVDDWNNILSIRDNVGDKNSCRVFSGVYLMDKTFLQQVLTIAVKSSSFFSIVDVLARHVPELDIKGYELKAPYIRCLDTFEHYYRYSLELLSADVRQRLIRREWPINTKSYDTPPTFYSRTSSVSDSLIANGCVIDGAVKHSILGRSVRVASGAKISNSIIFSDVDIGPDVVIENAVIDRDVRVDTVGITVKGTPEEPVYIKRGDRI